MKFLLLTIIARAIVAQEYSVATTQDGVAFVRKSRSDEISGIFHGSATSIISLDSDSAIVVGYVDGKIFTHTSAGAIFFSEPSMAFHVTPSGHLLGHLNGVATVWDVLDTSAPLVGFLPSEIVTEERLQSAYFSHSPAAATPSPGSMLGGGMGTNDNALTTVNHQLEEWTGHYHCNPLVAIEHFRGSSPELQLTCCQQHVFAWPAYLEGTYQWGWEPAEDATAQQHLVSLALAPNGLVLVLGSRCTVWVLDGATGEQLRHFSLSSGDSTCLADAFARGSPTPTFAAVTVGGRAALVKFDLDSGAVDTSWASAGLRVLPLGEGGFIKSAYVDGSGRVLVAGGAKSAESSATVAPPAKSPTRVPTKTPTKTPTRAPTKNPTPAPSVNPIVSCHQGMDFDNDMIFGVSDLAVLLANWGHCESYAVSRHFGCNQTLDANGDFTIGVTDLAYLLASWGPCNPFTRMSKKQAHFTQRLLRKRGSSDGISESRRRKTRDSKTRGNSINHRRSSEFEGASRRREEYTRPTATRPFFARLLADGSLDASFAQGGVTAPFPAPSGGLAGCRPVSITLTDDISGEAIAESRWRLFTESHFGRGSTELLQLTSSSACLADGIHYFRVSANGFSAEVLTTRLVDAATTSLAFALSADWPVVETVVENYVKCDSAVPHAPMDDFLTLRTIEVEHVFRATSVSIYLDWDWTDITDLDINLSNNEVSGEYISVNWGFPKGGDNIHQARLSDDTSRYLEDQPGPVGPGAFLSDDEVSLAGGHSYGPWVLALFDFSSLSGIRGYFDTWCVCLNTPQEQCTPAHASTPAQLAAIDAMQRVSYPALPSKYEKIVKCVDFGAAGLPVPDTREDTIVTIEAWTSAEKKLAADVNFYVEIDAYNIGHDPFLGGWVANRETGRECSLFDFFTSEHYGRTEGFLVDDQPVPSGRIGTRMQVASIGLGFSHSKVGPTWDLHMSSDEKYGETGDPPRLRSACVCINALPEECASSLAPTVAPAPTAPTPGTLSRAPTPAPHTASEPPTPQAPTSAPTAAPTPPDAFATPCGALWDLPQNCSCDSASLAHCPKGQQVDAASHCGSCRSFVVSQATVTLNQSEPLPFFQIHLETQSDAPYFLVAFLVGEWRRMAVVDERENVALLGPLDAEPGSLTCRLERLDGAGYTDDFQVMIPVLTPTSTAAQGRERFMLLANQILQMELTELSETPQSFTDSFAMLKQFVADGLSTVGDLPEDEQLVHFWSLAGDVLQPAVSQLKHRQQLQQKIDASVWIVDVCEVYPTSDPRIATCLRNEDIDSEAVRTVQSFVTAANDLVTLVDALAPNLKVTPWGAPIFALVKVLHFVSQSAGIARDMFLYSALDSVDFDLLSRSDAFPSPFHDVGDLTLRARGSFTPRVSAAQGGFDIFTLLFDLAWSKLKLPNKFLIRARVHPVKSAVGDLAVFLDPRESATIWLVDSRLRNLMAYVFNEVINLFAGVIRDLIGFLPLESDSFAIDPLEVPLGGDLPLFPHRERVYPDGVGPDLGNNAESSAIELPVLLQKPLVEDPVYPSPDTDPCGNFVVLETEMESEPVLQLALRGAIPGVDEPIEWPSHEDPIQVRCNFVVSWKRHAGVKSRLLQVSHPLVWTNYPPYVTASFYVPAVDLWLEERDGYLVHESAPGSLLHQALELVKQYTGDIESDPIEVKFAIKYIEWYQLYVITSATDGSINLSWKHSDFQAEYAKWHWQCLGCPPKHPQFQFQISDPYGGLLPIDTDTKICYVVVPLESVTVNPFKGETFVVAEDWFECLDSVSDISIQPSDQWVDWTFRYTTSFSHRPRVEMTVNSYKADAGDYLVTLTLARSSGGTSTVQLSVHLEGLQKSPLTSCEACRKWCVYQTGGWDRTTPWDCSAQHLAAFCAPGSACAAPEAEDQAAAIEYNPSGWYGGIAVCRIHCYSDPTYFRRTTCNCATTTYNSGLGDAGCSAHFDDLQSCTSSCSYDPCP